MRRSALPLAGLALFAAASGEAYTNAPPIGYLKSGQVPDLIAILPPPPPTGSSAQANDRAAFEATRKLQGTPRWDLAARDAAIQPVDMLADYNCATGATLDARSAPTLAKMFARILVDLSPSVGRPKGFYKRTRPYVGTGAPICVPDDDELSKSFDYPSGHATYGWATALVLAEADPGHATTILTRGRAYGESRVVCGVHTPSAVAAGRTDAAVLVAALHTDSDFRRDLAKARHELATLARAPTPACAVEAALLGSTPY